MRCKEGVPAIERGMFVVIMIFCRYLSLFDFFYFLLWGGRINDGQSWVICCSTVQKGDLKAVQARGQVPPPRP